MVVVAFRNRVRGPAEGILDPAVVGIAAAAVVDWGWLSHRPVSAFEGCGTWASGVLTSTKLVAVVLRLLLLLLSLLRRVVTMLVSRQATTTIRSIIADANLGGGPWVIETGLG